MKISPQVKRRLPHGARRLARRTAADSSVDRNSCGTAALLAPAPALADGVQLIGEYENSGYRQPPSIVRRSDGQVIQLPDLLYRVLVHADGRNSYVDIAGAVSQEVGRVLEAEGAQFLIEEKLRPMGLVTLPDGSSPRVPKPDPFLALKFRMAVIPERMSRVLGDTFAWLFWPVMVLAALAALGVTDVWLFFHHGVAQALRQAIEHPDLFLPLFAGVVLGAAFHETGHAAACRYSGGNPGRMGCGLYLAWPAFYTDVTDAYRLGRRGRLRTDLGGVYFNVIIVLATVGIYFVTRANAVLLLVIVEHFEIAHQLLPMVRLDGYYIVADLTGVPDLFARIGPILRSLVPWRGTDPRAQVLKPWVRAAVTGWVLFVVPILALELLMVIIHLPRILGTAWSTTQKLASATSGSVHDGAILAASSSALEIALLAVPIIGIFLMLWRLFSVTIRWAKRSTDGRPGLRLGAFACALVAGAVILASWITPGNYRPLQPGETGTIGEGTASFGRLATGHTVIDGPARPIARNRVVPGSGPPTPTTSPPTTTARGSSANTAPVAPSSTAAGTSSTTSPLSPSTTALGTSTTSPSSPPTTALGSPSTTTLSASSTTATTSTAQTAAPTTTAATPTSTPTATTTATSTGSTP